MTTTLTPKEEDLLTVEEEASATDEAVEAEEDVEGFESFNSDCNAVSGAKGVNGSTSSTDVEGFESFKGTEGSTFSSTTDEDVEGFESFKGVNGSTFYTKKYGYMKGKNPITSCYRTKKALKESDNYGCKTVEEFHKKLKEYLDTVNTGWIRAGSVLSMEFSPMVSGFCGRDLFKEMYMSCVDDPTEVKFVDTHLCGSWTLWTKIRSAGCFQDFYKELKEEARQRFVSLFIGSVRDIAMDESNKSRFSALKYLCDTSFSEIEKRQETATERRRGRPSKAEMEANRVQLLKDNEELEEMFKRLQ